MWEDLPPELLLKIFSYLSTSDLLHSGTVCKRWHAVSRDNNLWKNLLSSQLSSKLQSLPEKTPSWHEEYKRISAISSTRCSQAVEGGFRDEVWHVCFSHNGEDGNVLMFAVDKLSCQCADLYSMMDKLVDLGCYHSQYTEFSPNDSLFLLSSMESLDNSRAKTMICSAEDGTILLVLQSEYKDVYGTWVNSDWFLTPSIQGNFLDGHYVTIELHHVKEERRNCGMMRKKLFTSRVRSVNSMLCIDRMIAADPGRHSDLSDMLVLVRRLYRDRAEIASFRLPVDEMDTDLCTSSAQCREQWAQEIDHQLEIGKIDLPGVPSGYSLSPNHQSLFTVMTDSFENIFELGPLAPSQLYEIDVPTLTMKRQFFELLPKLNMWCFIFPTVTSQYVAS